MPKLLELPFRMLWNKPGEEKSSPCGSSGIGGLVFGASMDFFYPTRNFMEWGSLRFWWFLLIFFCSPQNFRQPIFWAENWELGKKNTRSLNFGGPELGENTKRLLRMSKKHDQILVISSQYNPCLNCKMYCKGCAFNLYVMSWWYPSGYKWVLFLLIPRGSNQC